MMGFHPKCTKCGKETRKLEPDVSGVDKCYDCDIIFA